MNLSKIESIISNESKKLSAAAIPIGHSSWYINKQIQFHCSFNKNMKFNALFALNT